MKIGESDVLVGHRYHTAGSEPYFLNTSYTYTKRLGAIPVDLNGRCVVSEEIGDRDKVTMRPLKWICTNECRNLTSEEVAIVLRTKSLFQMSIVHTTSTSSRLSCHHMPPIVLYFANQLVIATIRYFYAHIYVKSDLLPTLITCRSCPQILLSWKHILIILHGAMLSQIYMQSCSSLPEFPHYPALLHVGYTSMFRLEHFQIWPIKF